MAAINKRGNKWLARVRVKGYDAVAKSFTSRADAEAWSRVVEAEIIRGIYIKRTDAERTTMYELFDRYAREVTSQKRGKAQELNRIERFKKSKLAKLSAAAVSGQVVAAWRDERLEEVSGPTVLRDLVLLSNVFSVAIREWSIGLRSNPVTMVRKPAPGRGRSRVLTDDEREALLNACGDCQNTWVKPVVQFALETGARRGEILSLTWSDMDLNRGTAKVDGKTGGRVIPLSGACVAMLHRLPRSLGGRVFPVTVEALRQAYLRAVKRAGLDNWTFHDCRHDALTRLAKLGLSILELRVISGHATANQLQTYVAIDPAELAKKLG